MPIDGALKDRAIKSAGGLSEFQRKSKSYSDNVRYLETNKSTIIKDHDKKWIAIYNTSLVGHSKSLPELMKELGKKGIPEEEALIQFVSSEPILTLYFK